MAAARRGTKGKEKVGPKGESTTTTKGAAAPAPPVAVLDEFEDDDEIDDDGFDDGEGEEDEDDGLGDGDELDDAFEDDAPISPIDEIDYRLRQALEAGQGSPWRICVRQLRRPGQPGANLRPVKGYLDLAALSSAGSLVEAVRRKVGEPGEYVVQLEDPVNKKRARWTRYVTIQPSEGTQEVKEVEVARDRTIARKKLLEAEAELAQAEQALVNARNGGGSNDRMAAVLEAVDARLQRLEEKRSGDGPPAWVSTVLASPLVAKVLGRLLAPPQSASSALAEIVPLMNTVMQASAQAQLESVKGENKRTDVLLDHALQVLAAREGIQPEEDDSVLGIASKVLEMMRPQLPPAAPPAPAAPTAAPAPVVPREPRRPPTPFSKFVSGALALAQQGMEPEDAVSKILDRWERVPRAQKRLFLSGNMQAVDRVIGTLPADLKGRLTAFVQGGGQTWVLGLWDVLRELEAAPDPDDGEGEAPVPEKESPVTSAAG